jgi:hypothetical protein
MPPRRRTCSKFSPTISLRPVTDNPDRKELVAKHLKELEAKRK